MAGAGRALEGLFALYFLSHIPVTLLLDAQAVSSRFHPPALAEALRRYTASFRDPLMAQRPAWFQAFVYCEVFLQLPFFPVAAYAFWKACFGSSWPQLSNNVLIGRLGHSSFFALLGATVVFPLYWMPMQMQKLARLLNRANPFLAIRISEDYAFGLYLRYIVLHFVALMAWSNKVTFMSDPTYVTSNCKWIRTPAIIYATHVATTLVPLLAHFLFHDFSDSKPAGPQTWHERLWLLAVYSPYLLIPLLLLMTMLLHPSYSSGGKWKTT